MTPPVVSPGWSNVCSMYQDLAESCQMVKGYLRLLYVEPPIIGGEPRCQISGFQGICPDCKMISECRLERFVEIPYDDFKKVKKISQICPDWTHDVGFLTYRGSYVRSLRHVTCTAYDDAVLKFRSYLLFYTSISIPCDLPPCLSSS